MDVFNERAWRTSWARLSISLVCATIGYAPLPVYSFGPFNESGANNPIDRSEIAVAAQSALNLSAGELVTVQFSQIAGASLRVIVTSEKEQRVMELVAESVRAPNYELLVQRPDGSYETVEPGPVQTFRGRMVGFDGGLVAASIDDVGLHALMILPDGRRQWLEPLNGRVAGVAANQFVLYHDHDVASADASCATDSPAMGHKRDRPGSTVGVAGGPLYIAQLGIDSDADFYQDYGSVAATEAQINATINTMNLQYERDIDVRHIITTIIVRPTEPDGYSGSDVGGLVNQFRDRWVEEMNHVQRDAAQLFSGKSPSSGTAIGIAITNSLCRKDAAYSVVMPNVTSCAAFACKTDLSAHELGHIWSAGHCSCPGWTMNATLNSANRFHPTFDIPDLIAFRNMQTCLSFGDPCDPQGTLDCNTNGVADACDIQGEASPDADANGVPDECQPPPMPQSENTPYNKTRVISFYLPWVATTIPGAQTAIRFKLVDLQNPIPANIPTSPPQDFSSFEVGASCTDPAGCVRWVGKPDIFRESQEIPDSGTFKAARLQCTPYYADWTTENLVHVIGAELLPSSTYKVEALAADCMGSEASCSMVSPYTILTTARYGDITEPFNPPDTSTQPNVTDISVQVTKFKNIPGAPSKSFAQLQANVLDLFTDISVSDIVTVVDAYKRYAYPFSGPCPCPSLASCEALPCTGPEVCMASQLMGLGSAALCVKTCLGGDNDGQPCKKDAHCPGATCGPGFCRDRCGRCTP